MTINLTKQLIKRDILVVSGGCGNHALEVAGLCTVEAANEMAGGGLKEVCNMLKMPPVLSFGTCTDTGNLSSHSKCSKKILLIDILVLNIIFSLKIT